MSKKKWAYHLPTFESDTYNKEMMVYSPWSGHRNFAYDYVCFKKPSKIVELGSYYGCSAFAFLQAIKDKSLDSQFYGIDTWQGDSFTEKDYQEDIYSQYKRIQDNCFHNQNTNMLRMTFDQASKIFADKSIDLLHIDGSHTYEDVKQDFLLWKNKVKEDGVVFFHDIGKDKLLGEAMGSHIFWEEIKQEYTQTIEFPFSFGLGVLFFSKTEYQEMIESVDLLAYQRLVNYADVQNKDIIRKYYFEIRDLKKHNKFLKEQVQINSEELDKYQNTITDTVTAYKKMIAEKNGYITELKQVITNYQTDASGKDDYITKLQQSIASYQKDAAGKDAYILELQETIERYQSDITGKDTYIKELLMQVKEWESFADSKESYIKELLNDVEKYKETFRGKDKYISELELNSEALNEQLRVDQGLQEQLTEMQKHLSVLETALSKIPFSKYIYKRLENTNEGNNNE